MEKSDFYKNIKKLKLIAHRLGFVMTNYPENSLEVLKDIFSNSQKLNACNGFEFDICFTKEHIPIVIHDKYIDDISTNKGLIKKYNLDDLRKINFNFRKSLKDNKNFEFKIATLEEMLNFFSNNKNLLKDKIIKIETKDIAITNKRNLKNLADIINKFPELSNNIIHLSFYPNNLINLKRIQKKREYKITKSDLLCDYSCIVFLSKLIKEIDFVSLRIKTKSFPKLNKRNSQNVNKKIFLDKLCMKFSNALNDKNIKYAINKYGSVGIYVLNSEYEIEEFCNKINSETFKNHYSNIYFTTDNPLYIKSLEK